MERDGIRWWKKDGIKWWNLKGKKLHGGLVKLPNLKFMKVGIEKLSNSYLIYISWYEM